MTRIWSSAGYFVCSHRGCSKKARPEYDLAERPNDWGGTEIVATEIVTDHDCCGHSKHATEHAYWKRDGMPEGPGRNPEA